jgi:hypothetical protein
MHLRSRRRPNLIPIHSLRRLHLKLLLRLIPIITPITITRRLTGLIIARGTTIVSTILLILLRIRLLLRIVGIVLSRSVAPWCLACPSSAVEGAETSTAAATGGEAAVNMSVFCVERGMGGNVPAEEEQQDDSHKDDYECHPSAPVVPGRVAVDVVAEVVDAPVRGSIVSGSRHWGCEKTDELMVKWLRGRDW